MFLEKIDCMLTLENLRSKKIGIVGFGKEGQAVASFLDSQNLFATVYDSKNRDEFDDEVLKKLEANRFTFKFGESLKSFDDSEVIFRSPGFPRLSEGLLEAETRGAIITSQTKWFFDHCPALIIGVTGTKGKGTTVTLIAEILNKAKELGIVSDIILEDSDIYVTGNIGKDDPFELLRKLKNTDIVVFELSSFQLQDLTKSPRIAVCLMITQEHLDHHKDIEEYRRAKSSIVRYQNESDVCIYNWDYPGTVAIGRLGQGRKFMVSRHRQIENGVYASGEQIIVSGMMQNGKIDVSKRILKGAHNLENICSAVAVAVMLGVPLEVQQGTIVNFKGLEHRLEFVGEVRGVKFYNDSISTVPESSMAAIEAFKEPKVIILGGSDKGSEFDQLATTMQNSNIRCAVLIGEMTNKIHQALEAHGSEYPILTGANNMQEVLAQVKSIAQSGDVVLLSPACASFGMFKNYKDRGEQFKEWVSKF